MRVDLVSIFPQYFAPLELSLSGKARDKGLLDLRVHDLRTWTHDRHRTVDDAPYGGGAGMVMRPEPWGEALDALEVDGATLVVPTPAGRPFTQAVARELSAQPRLVFACGRYEGIDQRVVDHYTGRCEVWELSIGDYVLNGGEVAALAMVEAVVRLLPGFMGNPGSLAEESHEAGLLEYPVYTRPASWRGLPVPEVLLSGDHAAIAAWRHRQSRHRTVAHRPDLLHPSAAVDIADAAGEIRPAVPADAAELLTLQRACWLPEQPDGVGQGAGPDIGPGAGVEASALEEDLAAVQDWLPAWRVWVLRVAGRLVGAVRARQDGEEWHIGRLVVAPDLWDRGLGRLLLEHAERAAPADATAYVLDIGAGGARHLRPYRKAGYRPTGQPAAGTVRLVKRPDR